MNLRPVAAAALLAGVAIAGIPGAQVVSAKPVITTKYTYYNIAGRDARSLYRQMLRRGPHVSGAKAFASTTASTSHDGQLTGGRSCRVTNYKVRMNFTINLPRLSSAAGLPAADRKRWAAFAAFVRRHEERHRTIWIGCARELERRIRAVRGVNCDQTDRKAAQIFEQVRAVCDRRHDAFDAAEQKRLARHPLIVAAQRVQRASPTRRVAARPARRSGRSFGLTRGIKRGRAAD